MGKREEYRRQLDALGDESSALEGYLCKNSGLPGRRANLELANAFSERVATQGLTPRTLALLEQWAALSSTEAPTNSRREYLTFVAVQALGPQLAGADHDRHERLFARLRSAASDSRWRTREACAIALQLLGEQRFDALRGHVAAWLADSRPAERRAIIAALAHPPLYETERGPRVEWALEIVERVLLDYRRMSPEARKAEDVLVLKRGLEYSLSVLVAAEPERGFRFLRRWAETDDIEIKKIIAANLRKSRLAKLHPDACQEVGEILSWGL
jgi:hypothetical protein